MRAARSRRCRGGVLLEVVLALALFVGTASVIVGAINASIRAASQLRLEARAADVAVSILSQVQMGLIPPVETSPQPLEAPLEGWTWEITSSAPETSIEGVDLRRIEIIVRDPARQYTHRLAQLLHVGDDAGAEVLVTPLPPEIMP